MRSFDPNDLDPASPHHNTPNSVIVDGLGRQVLQRLALDSSGTLREYRSTWDARDLLLSRELPDATQRRWSYDSLGRTTSVTDPNAGTQHRRYDDLGHVVEQENATGELVINRYDPLGRLWEVALQDTIGGTQETVARYRYDVAVDERFPANHARGRLSARFEEGFDTYVDYDARGQLVRQFRVVDDARVYTTGGRYDAAGRVTHTVYADGSALTTRFDAQGRVAGLDEIIDDIRYNPNGTVGQIDYANGVVREHTFDERLRMRRYQLSSPSAGALFDVQLDYDQAGVPTAVTDGLHDEGPLSQTRSWDYDAFYRPTRMQSVGAGELEYAYSPANSLVRRAQRGTPATGSTRQDEAAPGDYELGGDAPDGLFAGPHQVTRVGRRHLGYDPNGQLVLDRRSARDSGQGDDEAEGDRHLYWDAAGRLREVVLADGRRVTHTYNGAFDRMSRTLYSSSGDEVARTLYLSPVEELRYRERGTEYAKVVMLGGERVAEVRVAGDPGETLAGFEAPEVAPWAEDSWDVPAATPPPDDADEGALQRIFGSPSAMTGALLLALLAVALTLFYAWRRGAAIVRKQVLAGARAALALLLSGAMTVIGLPSCAGGGGGRESWQPTNFVGPDDEVVFLHAPMLGTPAIQTDRRGLVHNRQLSTPYGVRTAHEGADPDSFRFTDKEWDELTGLIYFGARYYDAELGTWISVDPLALWGDDGSLSPFDLNATAYVGGRVTIAVDEFGFEGVARVSSDDAQAVGPRLSSQSAAEQTQHFESIFESGTRVGVYDAGGATQDAIQRAVEVGFSEENIFVIAENGARSRASEWMSARATEHAQSQGSATASHIADRAQSAALRARAAGMMEIASGAVGVGFTIAAAVATGGVTLPIFLGGVVAVSGLGGGVYQTTAGVPSYSLLGEATNAALGRRASGQSWAQRMEYAETAAGMILSFGGLIRAGQNLANASTAGSRSLQAVERARRAQRIDSLQISWDVNAAPTLHLSDDLWNVGRRSND